MNVGLTVAGLAVAAYLIGGIPFGLLAGWTRGIDVRRAGSGNIGATNVSRLLGRGYGVAVFVLDVLKGLLPTLAAGRALAGPVGEAEVSEPVRYLCWLHIGAACVLGHNYPLYLGFRGGKGVSTSLGVALGIYPLLTWAGVLAFAVWGVVLAISRYVSLASVAAGLAFPVGFAVVARWQGRSVVGELWPLLVFSVLLAVMVVIRHRANLARLRAGTEARIGSSRARPPSDTRS